MTAPAADRGYSDGLADDVHAAAGRFRAAWSWLGDARIPGPVGPAADRPPPRDAARRAGQLAEQLAADRAAAAASIRMRMAPGRDRPPPARLHAIEARQRIADAITTLAHRLWTHVHGPGPAGDAARARAIVDIDIDRARAVVVPCDWCAGTGVTQRPAGWSWEWPADPPACPRCYLGRVPTGNRCPGCYAAGWCGCDRTDLLVGLSLDLLVGLVDVVNVETAAGVETVLNEAADRAEAAAGAGRDRRQIPGPTPPECPVCGSRELHAEVSSPKRREWSIRCLGPDCYCLGWGCPCGIGTARREGRRHVWPARRWDGPDGLAARLGVTLPGTRRWDWPKVLAEAHAMNRDYDRRAAELDKKPQATPPRRRRRKDPNQ